eukprot:768660-Hanusia_phi.AAC.3
MHRSECLRTLEIDAMEPTNEEIKAAYKRIALRTHPDKLVNIDDEERKQREEQFKKASAAYNKLINGVEDFDDIDDIFGGGFPMDGEMMDFFQNTMTDLASEIYNKYKSGEFKNINKAFVGLYGMHQPKNDGMSNMTDMLFNCMTNMQFGDENDDNTNDVIEINVKCSYADVMQCKKKSVIMDLGKHKSVLEIDFGKYPVQTKIVDGREMKINMSFKHRLDCSHKEHADGSVDLIRQLYISPYEFYKGSKRIFKHYSGNLEIKLGSCQEEIEIEDGGLFGGKLILKISVKLPTIKKIKEELTQEEYTGLMFLLRKISKSI